MKKQYTPLLIIALAVVVGGYIAFKPATPVANAEITAMYEKIPTASGKALFKVQSENLTTISSPQGSPPYGTAFPKAQRIEPLRPCISAASAAVR